MIMAFHAAFCLKKTRTSSAVHSFRMENWFSGLEQRLPHWLAKTQTQWVQWVYAIWQLVRCNPVILLVLSYVPFMLSQYCRKKTVVVLGKSREYFMNSDKFLNRFKDSEVRLKNLEEASRHYEEGDPDKPFWYTLKHHDYYYITHIHALGDLINCKERFGENIIFVESLRKVSRSVAVGKRLSETEAYEKILTKHYLCGKGADLVVPTSFNYVDFSSKFWVVMSTLPLLLQANNYEKLSTLLSLILILSDLKRGWLYRTYDRLFKGFTKFVKLNFFKKRTGFYDFFSIFSSRWGYTDSVKKHAYAAQPDDRLIISWFGKLKNPDDVEIVGWKRHHEDPRIDNIFMEIDIDEAHCDQMKYFDLYTEVALRKPVYVL